jgi:hypothetical protein
VQEELLSIERIIMEQLLQDQNKVEGAAPMNASQMESTTGAVLSFLKSQGINIDAVQKSIPNAETLMTQAETTNAKSETTTAGKVMGKLGGLLAGASPTVLANNSTTTETATATTGKPVDSIPAMLKVLSTAGVSPDQMTTVLPLVASTLKNKCGVDAYATLGIEPPPAAAAAAGKSGGGGILGGLRGFLSDIRSETTGKDPSTTMG